MSAKKGVVTYWGEKFGIEPKHDSGGHQPGVQKGGVPIPSPKRTPLEIERGIIDYGLKATPLKT